MPTTLSQSFELWKIEHSIASSAFKRFCLKRFGQSKTIKNFLKCLPTHQSELWRDGVFRCLLWDELAITEVLSVRSTTRYMPMGTLGDGSWLALDFGDDDTSLYPTIGTFPLEWCEEDDWTILSPDTFRRLSDDYADYLQLIFHKPELELLIGIKDLTKREFFEQLNDEILYPRERL